MCYVKRPSVWVRAQDIGASGSVMAGGDPDARRDYGRHRRVLDSRRYSAKPGQEHSSGYRLHWGPGNLPFFDSGRPSLRERGSGGVVGR